jgi:dihydrofolate reductase
MSKIKVACYTISLDGFGAGPMQTRENPLGIGGEELHTWMFATKRFRQMMKQDGGSEGIDNGLVERSFENIGAEIMGRNMFGPIRGDWPDDKWKGWWGENPPYHCPVFVLTHYKRAPIEMKGNTTFHFVTDGIESAVKKARQAAGDKDIRVGGGASTIRQLLQAGYIDELHFVISPRFLGSGEPLFSGIDFTKLGFKNIQQIFGEGATHIILARE